MKKKGSGKHRNRFLILGISPIVLLVVSAFIIFAQQKNQLRETYDLDDSETSSWKIVFDQAHLLNSYTKKDYAGIETDLQEDSTRCQDKVYLDKVNKTLLDKYSFLVVMKDGQCTYFGNSDYRDKIELDNCTSMGTVSTGDSENALYITQGEEHYLYKMIYVESQKAEVVLVTDLNVALPHLRLLGVGFVILCVVIIVIMSIAIMGYLYSSILKPIQKLQLAVNCICMGDLEYQVEAGETGEFQPLYEDFEKMRINLKESLEQKEQADLLTREVIGNISHDLKTPLTAIKGYSEGILDGVANTPERLEKYIRTIHTKATDMALLVDELAFFTSINQNQVKYRFMDVDAGTYFSNTVSELSLDLEMKNINLIFQNRLKSPISIFIDVDKMKRVINNIIGNARKYIKHDKGIIILRLEEVDHELQVRIEDNGAGIEENELPYVFDRFYRTDSSRNSTTGGSGLGLAITKKIIEDHGGMIRAESTKDVGTAIIFRLKEKVRN